MTGIKVQLLQLDRISEQRKKILSTQDELTKYMSDISSLYGTLHSESVRVSSEVSDRYLNIVLHSLPGTSSAISRYVKVEVTPYLASLLCHHGNSHVISLQPSSEGGLITVELPLLSGAVLVRVRVSLLYKCPLPIEGMLPENRKYFEFEVYSRTIPPPSSNPRPAPHYTTRALPTILERYLSTQSHDHYTLSIHSTHTQCTHAQSTVSGGLPGGLLGEVKRSGESEYQISNLSREELLGTVVRLRENGILLGTGLCSVRNEISLSSSLENLLDVYQQVRGISRT